MSDPRFKSIIDVLQVLWNGLRQFVASFAQSCRMFWRSLSKDAEDLGNLLRENEWVQVLSFRKGEGGRQSRSSSSNWKVQVRKIHYWLSVAFALPVVITICSGILLLWKKQSDWVQPPMQQGAGTIPTLAYDQLLETARQVPEAGIEDWSDIARLDVRPEKGIVKVRAKNRWELQLDHQSGELLQVMYRRSDMIESIHDGAFFHEKAKLWIFFPSALTLLTLWMTGLVLFMIPFPAKVRKWKRERKRRKPSMSGESG